MSKLSSIHGKTGRILDSIEQKLNEGFKIKGWDYQFLGASNSQVRDHGCWFVEVEKDCDTPRIIREYVGELSGWNLTQIMKTRKMCFGQSGQYRIWCICLNMQAYAQVNNFGLLLMEITVIIEVRDDFDCGGK